MNVLFSKTILAFILVCVSVESGEAAMIKDKSQDSLSFVASARCYIHSNISKDEVRVIGPVESGQTVDVSVLGGWSVWPAEDLDYDEMLKFLMGAKKDGLRALGFEGVSLQTDEIKLISEIDTLRELQFLSCTSIENHDFGELNKLKNLSRLVIWNCPDLIVTRIGEQIAKIKTLREVVCEGVISESIASFAALPNLDSLEFSTRFEEGDLECLKQFTMLRSLAFSEMPGISLRALIGIQIETLKLTRCGMGDQFVLEILPTLPKLKNLEVLTESRITDSGLSIISNLSDLETLKLVNMSKIGDGGISCLEHAKKLIDLTIVDVPVTDKSAQSLARIRGLTQLRLNKLNLTDRSVESLLKCSSLLHLDIRRSGISIKGTKDILAHMPQLKLIKLDRNQCDIKNLKSLREAYSSCDIQVESD